MKAENQFLIAFLGIALIQSLLAEFNKTASLEFSAMAILGRYILTLVFDAVIAAVVFGIGLLFKKRNSVERFLNVAVTVSIIFAFFSAARLFIR